MFNTFSANGVNDAFPEALFKMKVWGVEENSRNGKVLTSPVPVGFTMRNPKERVHLCPVRDANPFFHVVEALWMFAGHDDVEFLVPYNKNYVNYAEKAGHVHGAYGHRWRYHFDIDQIMSVCSILIKDNNDRRAVIGMWDAGVDLAADKKDVPCNTHIYLRIVNDKLNMTVCNRSNDLIWGMLGANIVHMTMLQEIIAEGCGAKLGTYNVMTNNLHVYEPHWPLLASPQVTQIHDHDPWPLIAEGESIEAFLYVARKFFSSKKHATNIYDGSKWIREVAVPMRHVWELRRYSHGYKYALKNIACPQWRRACTEWCERRDP